MSSTDDETPPTSNKRNTANIGLYIGERIRIRRMQDELACSPIALQARSSSADRTRSPGAVSGKRELFNEWPETFGIFGRHLEKRGVRRLPAELQKPAFGGLFCDGLRPNRDRPDCLAGDTVLIAPVSGQIPC
jgi:hypothetical protein